MSKRKRKTGKMSKKESKQLDLIDNIDVKKECIKIVQDPKEYFKKSFNISNNDFYTICVKFAIIKKIRDIDTMTDISDYLASYFVKKYSIKKWINIISDFYSYYNVIIKDVLNNYENIILDLYNDKQITKESMTIGMTTFQKTKKIIINDIEIIEKYIEDLEGQNQKLG